MFIIIIFKIMCMFELITIQFDAIVFAPLKKRFQVVVVFSTIFPMDNHIVCHADNACQTIECYKLLLEDL